tara:strand:- start:1139 stop:1708 length:570 start_codon:yes stop_codon:yes gene_type:complete
MKRKLEFIVLATGILSLVYVNLFALRANRLVDSGREVLLELAPVDPLSLVQGQYMELEFAIEDSYSLDDAEVQPISSDRDLDQDESGRADRDAAWDVDRVVLWLDENDVGRVQRPYQGGSLSEGEILFRASVDVSERTYHVRLQQRSFLFEENQEHRYQNARLGIFRVKENGDYVLVDLADKDFRPLTP